MMKKILLFLSMLISFGYLNAQSILHPFNLNFEDSEKGKMPVAWVLPGYAVSMGYSAEASTLNPYNGKYCLELSYFGNYQEGVYGSVMQSIDAKPFKGKKIRFRAAVRAEISSAKGSAHLWVREHLSNDQDGMFDMMEDHPILFNEWQFYQIEMDISEYADVVNYGLLLRGSGKAWIDAASFDVVETEEKSYAPPKELSDRELNNLFNFSKLFGYIRYYYPSYESMKINWENFAFNSIKLIEKANSRLELINTLNDIFLPIAPLLKINDAENPNKSTIYTKPKEALDNIYLSWLHHGIPIENKSNIIKSEVVNIYHTQREFDGIVSQVVDASNLKGKTIEFSCYAKADVDPIFGNAQIWIRADKVNDKIIKSFSNQDNPIKDNKWKKYSISFEVPEETAYLRPALVLWGEGKVWFDSVSIIIKDDKRSENYIKNWDFEDGELGKIVRG